MTFHLTEKRSFGSGPTAHIQHSWDSSSLSTFIRCPRRYFYQYILDYRSKNESHDLVFGSLIHAGFEAYHIALAQKIPFDTAQYLGLRAILEDAWKDEGGYWVSHSPNKNLWNCLRSFIWHTEQFAYEGDIRTAILGEGEQKLIGVELPFSIDLDLKIGGFAISYCGHLDRVVDTDNGRWIVDYKSTTKTMGPYYFEGFNPSTQLPGYNAAGQIIFHEPIQGIIIDGVQVGVDFSRFARGHVMSTKETTAEWFDNARYWIKTAVTLGIKAIEEEPGISASREDYAVANAHHYPMNTEACFICPFKSVCSVTPSIRGLMLADNFTTQVWDPLARQGARKK